jgi:hypothetical protein
MGDGDAVSASRHAPDLANDPAAPAIDDGQTIAMSDVHTV